MPLRPSCPVVAVVGAGFCGTLVTVLLARAGGLRIVLLDRTGRFGPGLAYGTPRPVHLLNTPAGRMSAFADDPEHFTRWARGKDPGVTGGSFLPRARYGAYLQELLVAAATADDQPEDELDPLAETWRPGRPLKSPRSAQETLSGQLHEAPGVTCLQGHVVDLVPSGDGLRLRFADNRTLRADRVVLCPGNPGPAEPAGLPAAVRDDPRYFADPWALDPRRIDPAAPVLLLGTGLTALDVTLTLAEVGHRGPVHLASRRGLLPQPHRSPARPGTYPTPDVAAWPATARGYLRALRAEIREAATAGADWREVIASLRPVTQALWQRLPIDEQDRFLRHLRPFWDSHRHRAAPATHAPVAALRASGRVHVHAARLVDVVAEPAGLRVTLAHGDRQTEHVVGALINCTGPAGDPRRADPLFTAMIKRGLAAVDPLALGLEIADDGRLIGRAGPSSRVWVAGPPRRPQLWETTAVLELAPQVADVAAALRASLG